MSFQRTLVTTALPYANGPVHIGHLAGVYVPADIYVRYLRLKGENVLFVGGSDEHGVPVTIRARKEGITLQGARHRPYDQDDSLQRLAQLREVRGDKEGVRGPHQVYVRHRH